MSNSQHCHKPGEVFSCTIPDSNLSRHGSGQSLFEGFSHREANVNLTRTNRRISHLQEAKRRLLVMSSGSSCLPLSSCARRSSVNEVPSTRVEEQWDFTDESVMLP